MVAVPARTCNQVMQAGSPDVNNTIFTIYKIEEDDVKHNACVVLVRHVAKHVMPIRL
jgi:hypothetical protein